METNANAPFDLDVKSLILDLDVPRMVEPANLCTPCHDVAVKRLREGHGTADGENEVQGPTSQR